MHLLCNKIKSTVTDNFGIILIIDMTTNMPAFFFNSGDLYGYLVKVYY